MQSQINSENDFIKIINNNFFSKIFILSGKNSFYKSGADKIIKKISNKNIFIYLKNSKEPNIYELKKINVSFNKFKPDLILAIGGGSVLDYAKILNSTPINLSLEKKIRKNHLINFKKKIKLIAVPTTAGSGAESTSSAVIYINKIKYSLENEVLIPDFYYLAPKLIIKSLKKIKSSSGFDAISQSIESIISLKSNNKSLNYAQKSLLISIDNFLTSLHKPNLINTYKMSLAANLSGKAINISRTTAPHAVSYPFTSHFGINHGHAVSLTLEKFLEFNYTNLKYSNSNFDLKNRFNLLFKIFKTNNINQLITKISKIKKKANLESDFSKLGININQNYGKILSGINEQRLSNNPIKINKDDVKFILLSKKLILE